VAYFQIICRHSPGENEEQHGHPLSGYAGNSVQSLTGHVLNTNVECHQTTFSNSDLCTEILV
jgi:hypothetical protein